MNIDDINAALRAWIQTSTDLPADKIINAYQTGATAIPPRPAPPFAVVYPPLAITRRGLFDEERLDASSDGVVTRVGLRQFAVQIQFFGAGSLARAHDAANGLERYDVRATLTAACLSVVSRGEPTNQTGLIQTRYEERAQLEPIFATADDSTETVGWIETVSGTATYDDGDPVAFRIE